MRSRVDSEVSGIHPKPGKLRLTIGYDGTDFVGSQAQPVGRSVQRELEQALARFGGKTVTTEFAGRTDRGVHAIGQVVATADLRPDASNESVQRALNHLLPKDIGVGTVVRTDGDFHPRYDAIWREYRYRIWVGDKQPISERIAWTRRSWIDPEAMSAAIVPLIGTHDFASFAGGGEGVPWSSRARMPRGTIRTVQHASVFPVDHWWGISSGGGFGLEVRLIADGFLPGLVRTVVGGLVTIGAGKRPVRWFEELLEKKDRRVGPAVAPACGLILWRVGYGSDVPDPDPNGISIVRVASSHLQNG